MFIPYKLCCTVDKTFSPPKMKKGRNTAAHKPNLAGEKKSFTDFTIATVKKHALPFYIVKMYFGKALKTSLTFAFHCRQLTVSVRLLFHIFGRFNPNIFMSKVGREDFFNGYVPIKSEQ